MIKIYIDWNVMSCMKRGDFEELSKILENKNKFLLVYSPSHIGDIKASIKNGDDEQKELVESDLNYLTKLTNNLCLSHSPSEKISLSFYQPRNLLEDSLIDNKLFENFSIDNLFNIPLEENPQFSGLFNILKDLLKSIPIESTLKEALDNPVSSEMLEKMFPTLKDNPTMEGFFQSFGKMLENVNEQEGYKDLRNIVQKVGVNSGHFNPNKNPFKVIENAYKKYGIDSLNINDYLQKNDSIPEWFNEITNEYILLDIHGFKADEIKVKGDKKKTFRNTTEDSFHTAFASRCEFYITQDNKNIEKTNAVYNKLNIYTNVLKPDEFVKYYNSFLNFHSCEEHLRSLINFIKNGMGFVEQIDENGKPYGLINYAPCYFFNFFNKILVPNKEQNIDADFILSKENPSYPYIIHFYEIEGCIKIFTDTFGVDVNGKGYFQFEEYNNNDIWEIRKWDNNLGVFNFKRINGWFQLYFYSK